jgi:radical SAM protein with 4Fe4S-binding SPASM domain
MTDELIRQNLIDDTPNNTILNTRDTHVMNPTLFKEYKESKVNVSTTPALIYLESVKGCPFDCLMCSLGKTPISHVPMELLDKLEPHYDELEYLSIHGDGEPLLTKHLEYFAEKSNKHKFTLHMNTTGELLTQQKSEKLANAHGLLIRFSIHAGTPEVYKRIIGGDFHKTLGKIKELVDFCKDKGPRHDFWFSFIVMKETVDSIEDFLRETHKAGVKSVRFTRLSPTAPIIFGSTKRDFTLKYFEQFNKDVIETFIRNRPKYDALAKELGIKIEYGTMSEYTKYSPSNMEEFKKYKLNSIGKITNKVTDRLISKRFLPIVPPKGDCIVPWYGQLIIKSDGDVRLCCSSPHGLGNLNEKSLEEIWNDTPIHEVRESFAQGKYPKACGYCKGFSIDTPPKDVLDLIRKTGI